MFNVKKKPKTKKSLDELLETLKENPLGVEYIKRGKDKDFELINAVPELKEMVLQAHKEINKKGGTPSCSCELNTPN